MIIYQKENIKGKSIEQIDTLSSIGVPADMINEIKNDINETADLIADDIEETKKMIDAKKEAANG